MSWGTVTVGRLALGERHEISDQVNANTGVRSVSLRGIEISTETHRDRNRALQEDVSLLMDAVVPVTFSRKSDRNGYYRVTDVGVDATYWQGEMSFFSWSLSLEFIGPDNAVDIESRLTGVVRANDFSLTGERWHAPAIGHMGYTTGSTSPAGVVERQGEGGTITVYRGIPAQVHPRWGCPVEAYQGGCVRLLVDGLERSGSGIRVSSQEWELSNGLIKVTPGGDTLLVSVWSGGAWHVKDWGILQASSLIPEFNQMAVRRNDNEAVSLRLIKFLSPSGVCTLDLTLRRGSRFVEGYFQRSIAGSLSVRLNTPESYVDNSASGYVVAAADDSAGNRFVIGSARTFSAHLSGGITRGSTTALDFFIGAAVGTAPGDGAVSLRDQYIASGSEDTGVILR